jgi:hypothetical protein
VKRLMTTESDEPCLMCGDDLRAHMSLTPDCPMFVGQSETAKLRDRIEQLTAVLAECKGCLPKQVVAYSGSDNRGFFHVENPLIARIDEALKEPKS